MCGSDSDSSHDREFLSKSKSSVFRACLALLSVLFMWESRASDRPWKFGGGGRARTPLGGGGGDRRKRGESSFGGDKKAALLEEEEGLTLRERKEEGEGG